MKTQTGIEHYNRVFTKRFVARRFVDVLCMGAGTWDIYDY